MKQTLCDSLSRLWWYAKLLFVTLVVSVVSLSGFTHNTAAGQSQDGILQNNVVCTAAYGCASASQFTNPDSDTNPYITEQAEGDMQTNQTQELPQSAHDLEEGQPQNTAPVFVAFGDSLTTGFSIPNCKTNRQTSPWGCVGTPTVQPYPNRLATILGYSYSDEPVVRTDFTPDQLERTGIWGYTVEEAVRAKQNGKNYEGQWAPQLTAIESATELVVGGLGINDLRFSDVLFWVRQYYHPSGNNVANAAQQILDNRSDDFDELFASLQKANDNGAQVVVGLYYNPYDTPNRFCGDLENIGRTVVDTLDAELFARSRQLRFDVADFRPAFENHGSGSQESFVFGSQCKTSTAVANWLPRWLGGGGGKEALAEGFDPHPNSAGVEAMVDIIKREVWGED